MPATDDPGGLAQHPPLHADLSLSELRIGLLSSLPPLMFAIAAIPGTHLIARFGIGAALMMAKPLSLTADHHSRCAVPSQ